MRSRKTQNYRKQLSVCNIKKIANVIFNLPWHIRKGKRTQLYSFHFFCLFSFLQLKQVHLNRISVGRESPIQLANKFCIDQL